jgi:hypothetical protein
MLNIKAQETLELDQHKVFMHRTLLWFTTDKGALSVMPKAAKAAKKRTKTKTISGKKKTMSASEMKKVKGGITDGTLTTKQPDAAIGMLLPAIQKVR